MKEVVCASLNEFLNSYQEHFPVKRPDSVGFSDIVFRGHRSKNYQLVSTLERFTRVNMCAISDYAHVMLKAYSEFTSYTQHRFEFDEQDVVSNCHRWETLRKINGFLSFLIHLRHIGFPSPLLDWTRSPYVAAYFAFADALDTEDVAIYAFLERAGAGKSSALEKPHIESVGPYVRSSERHHIQQAEYTVCLCRVRTQVGTTLTKHGEERKLWNDTWSFSSHEIAFAEEDDEQDILVKFVLPGLERSSVLSRLNLMNINAYTLFRNEEGLAKLLAYKHIR